MMNEEQRKQELVQNIVQLSEGVFWTINHFMCEHWFQMELTMDQFRVVRLLFLGGPARMGDIASELGVSSATASGVVNRLVERGLVLRRTPSKDRRVVLCVLSDDGERLISGLWEAHRDRSVELLESLDAAQLLMISRVVEALVSSNGEAMEQPYSRVVAGVTGKAALLENGEQAGNY